MKCHNSRVLARGWEIVVHVDRSDQNGSVEKMERKPDSCAA